MVYTGTGSYEHFTHSKCKFCTRCAMVPTCLRRFPAVRNASGIVALNLKLSPRLLPIRTGATKHLQPAIEAIAGSNASLARLTPVAIGASANEASASSSQERVLSSVASRTEAQAPRTAAPRCHRSTAARRPATKCSPGRSYCFLGCRSGLRKTNFPGGVLVVKSS